METVVYKDSPMAEYLEGEGEAGQTFVSPARSHFSDSTPSPSFAPRGLSTINSRLRRKMSRSLPVALPGAAETIARKPRAWSHSVKATLRRAENCRFLEQFRYLIVASQLLNDQMNLSRFSAVESASTSSESHRSTAFAAPSALSLTGVLMTVMATFLMAWMIYWARGGSQPQFHRGRVLLVFGVISLAIATLRSFVRRRSLENLRQRAIATANTLVTQCRDFDAAAAMTLTAIQDMELSSRGYRLLSPSPPISRMEVKGQARWGTKLRRALRVSITSCTSVVTHANTALKTLSESVDLDKYLEIYDLEYVNLPELDADVESLEAEDENAIKSLKASLLRFFIIRKLFLCSLLAIPSIGGGSDFSRWSTATEIMQQTAQVLKEETLRLRSAVHDHQELDTSTKLTVSTPDRKRSKTESSHLTAIHWGMRNVDAKIRLLREAVEKMTEGGVETGDIQSLIQTQYESMSNELQMMLRECEEGKTAWLAKSHGDHRGVQQRPSDSPTSPALSLDNNTVTTEGSPTDALRALNGDDTPRSSLDVSSSAENEEVFEAIAAPHRRISLTRDERIARVKEERIRAAAAKEQRQSSTNVMHELKSVLSLRSPGAHSGKRVTSL
ncbi:MAG: proliferating cell nuclear antigen [Watsoniomyces obsoletus]|nr:MAG: proliferating cell nuclear antigen [Watsoniomyces obsoletus]